VTTITDLSLMLESKFLGHILVREVGGSCESELDARELLRGVSAGLFVIIKNFVYYESINRELTRRLIYYS